MRSFIDMTNEKYEEVMSMLAGGDVERKQIISENKILKSTVQMMESHVKQLRESINEMEQYSRRECLEIKGIPVTKDENTDELVTKVGELMGLSIKEEIISVSHRLPISNRYKGKRTESTIIVKFVRRNTKELYYRARKVKVKDITTRNLGFPSHNKIYINESLTEKNKALFGKCMKVKRNLQYSFIWSSNGRIYLRKDQASPVTIIRNKEDITKLLTTVSR